MTEPLTESEHRHILLLAIRYFYGGHKLDDNAPCPACDNWANDFPKIVKASQDKREGA